jgi:hypothetical protein
MPPSLSLSPKAPRHELALDARVAHAGHGCSDVASWYLVGGQVTAVPRVIDRDRRYHDFLSRLEHHPDATLLKAVWDEAWRLAIWAGMRENATLGLQVMELKQSIAHLEGRLNELQFEEEVEKGSVYWEAAGD